MQNFRFSSSTIAERRETTSRTQERAYRYAMIDMAVATIVKDRTSDYYRFTISVDDRVHANRILNDHWRRSPAIVDACQWASAQFPPASRDTPSHGPLAHFGVIAVPVGLGIQARLQGFLRCPTALGSKSSTFSLYEDQVKRDLEAPAGLVTLAGALTFRLQSRNLWIANERLANGHFRALRENQQNPQQIRSYLAASSGGSHSSWEELEFLPHEVFQQVQG